MKLLATLFFTIMCFTSVRADYGYMRLSELVCNADYGAIGTIIKIDKNYFYLKVKEYVLNNLDKDTLAILKFEDWSCAKRYDSYKVGQNELVFFRKSNYVIDDYELLGYGGGDEFELPIFNDTIKYQSGYNRFESFKLSDFIYAVKDYSKLIANVKETSRLVNKEEQIQFSKKSYLHKRFIECKARREVKDFEIPRNGMLVNLERNYLYEDYENKIFISTLKSDSIYLWAEDADVWKVSNYYIVKPKNGWTRRYINVYSSNPKSEDKLLFQQLFEVIELPEPDIFFDESIKDTILYHSYRDAIPTVGYYLDDMHEDENLIYKFLNYDYEIISGKKKEIFKVKSEYGNKEFQDRLKIIKAGDIITISNAFVLYPNNKVKQIKNKTVIIKTE